MTTNIVNLKIPGNSVLIAPIAIEEKTVAGGIIVPARAQKRTNRGTIVCIGPGLLDLGTNSRIPLEVEVGDEVLFNKFSAMELSFDGVDYMQLQEEDILMVIDEDEDSMQFATTWNPGTNPDDVLAANGA